MGVCASIIAVSDGQEASSWKIQPTVLLAVFSSISNFALTTALSTGIAITWWRSCLHGTILSRLHYIADRGEGRSFLPALVGGFDSSKVAVLVALIAAANFGNNPLLQRATHVESTEIIVNETLMLDISDRIPDGLVGVVENGSDFTIIGSRQGLAIAQGWFWNETISTSATPGYFCDGSCAGQVRGAGISYNCSSVQQALDMSNASNSGDYVFIINTTVTESAEAVPSVVLTVLYVSDVNESCIATLTVDTCTIEAAVVEYPVIIQNTTVYLDQEKLNNVTVLSPYISSGDLLTAPEGTPAGPLEGLSDFIGGYLNTYVFVTLDSSPINAFYSGNYLLFADMFFQTDNSTYGSYSLAHCGLKWTSPTSYVLNSMHTFMFRAALRVGNGTEAQTFPVTRTKPTLLLYSDYRFLGIALAVEAVAFVSVAVLLSGWWELERRVSLSPLETAKAFQAPLMTKARHLMAVKMIAELGTDRVKYLPGQGIVSEGSTEDLESSSSDDLPEQPIVSDAPDGTEGNVEKESACQTVLNVQAESQENNSTAGSVVA